ncbi:RICIN domain-containing protein [Paenibacillus sp.]|uniref:RICIN domain-containing protein n=1 Tax=Paenibacillus sp. TaxID=58172 RepID=UPI0028115CA1|nr:RICIN domain-containing protein [Paenibacillus sp.]
MSGTARMGAPRRWAAYGLIAALLVALGLIQLSPIARAATVNVANGVQFTDTNGNVVHAHGGGMLNQGNYYYWLGENRDGTNLVSLYRSTDLKNWEFRAHLLSKSMGGELATANIERPKLLYNGATGKYVMWMHKENGVDYGEARVAVASASNIEGPYTYHGSFRPLGYDSRDMTVYNDNGTAYLFSSTRVNADMNVFRLTSDFLGVDALIRTMFVGQYREAPAVFKRGSTYFLITSGATGWNPNQAKYSTTSNIEGAWTNPTNFGNSTTFDSQSTFVVPVTGSATTSYLYLGDRWAGAWGEPVNNSKYVWLPLAFPTNTSLEMNWYPSIDIDTSTGVIAGNSSGGLFDPNAEYRLVNVGSGRALEVEGQSTADGANVDIWSYWGGANQKWKIEPAGNYYRLVNVGSGKALDVYQSSTANHGNVIQWSYWGGNNQQWTISDVGNGAYRLVNRNSGRSLDATGTANGSNVIQYDYWGGANQKWEIVPAN